MIDKPCSADRRPYGYVPDRRSPCRGSAYADIQVELTRLMFDGLLGTVIVGALGMVGGTAVVAAWYHDEFLWRLTSVMGLLAALRVAIVIAFQRRGQRDLTARNARRWELSYGIALLLICLSLVVSTVYNFRGGREHAAYWCTVGALSISSAINARIALRPWIGNASGLIILAALGYSLLRSRSR